MSRVAASIRAALSAVRAAMRNDGLRRIELAWSLAISAVTGYAVDAGTFLAAIAGPSAAAVTERIAAAHLARAAGATATAPAAAAHRGS